MLWLLRRLRTERSAYRMVCVLDNLRTAWRRYWMACVIDGLRTVRFADRTMQIESLVNLKLRHFRGVLQES